MVALQALLCCGGALLVPRNHSIEPVALLLAAVSLVVAIIPVEAVLRADKRYAPLPGWYPDERSSRANSRYRADSLVGWTLVPGQAIRWRINNESTTVRASALAMCPSLLVVGFIDEDWDRSLTAYQGFEGLAKPMFLLSGDSLRPATRTDRPGLLERAVRHTAVKRVGCGAGRSSR